MFSKRKALPASLRWNKAFLASFVADLARGGFTDIKVKLPIDLKSILNDNLTEEQVISGLKSRTITIEEFLNRERNYKAVILVCRNPTTNETIKVLFGNMSETTTFGDSTFPSGHSASSTLYVQSPDPARVYPLFDFVYHYLSKQGSSVLGVAILGFFFLLLLAAEALSLLTYGKGFLQVVWKAHPAIDLIAGLVGVVVVYYYFKAPIGLSVNERETVDLPHLIRRAIRGEFRDNPVVNLVLSIVATLVTALILHFLGL